MLKKLKMPKPKSLDTSELDMEEMPEETPSEEMGEGEAEQSSEDEGMEKHVGPELKAVSDEDLLAEVKKRGLMSQLESETGEESAEDAYI
jgi:hypothetical protein